MHDPRLVMGFDHREGSVRHLTLAQWLHEIDALRPAQIERADHATMVYDDAGIVLAIEANWDDIEGAT
jgi:hypothetical protein